MLVLLYYLLILIVFQILNMTQKYIINVQLLWDDWFNVVWFIHKKGYFIVLTMKKSYSIFKIWKSVPNSCSK